jgi:hypothetical protein
MIASDVQGCGHFRVGQDSNHCREIRAGWIAEGEHKRRHTVKAGSESTHLHALMLQGGLVATGVLPWRDPSLHHRFVPAARSIATSTQN